MALEIYEILQKLEQNGYVAYIVGGFVRDFLLHQSSLDVDICTNASPEVIERLFKQKVNNFGGINFKVAKYDITITSFRKDNDYKKGYPQKINFGVSLEEDLKRRDFTINTILMDKDGQILSYLNGLEDLENKIIKTVGEPLERFKEDPLRIIRALRFASVLNFKLDSKIEKIIKSNADLINQISITKIKQEINKIKSRESKERFEFLLTKLDLQNLKKSL